MQVPPKPFWFDGTYRNLYRTWIEPALPDPAAVGQFDRWLSKYSGENSAVFPIRSVRGLERRRTSPGQTRPPQGPGVQTHDGTHIVPADNSPAWAVHTALVAGWLSNYSQFRRFMQEIPCHIFDVRGSVGATASRDGYYFAHVFPAKNGDTAFQTWPHSEVVRRCYLTLHPCNFFLVPGGRRWGEDAGLIRFVASMHRRRYGATWNRFLKRTGGSIAALRGGRAARTAGDIGAENRGAERGDPLALRSLGEAAPPANEGERRSASFTSAQPSGAPRQSMDTSDPQRVVQRAAPLQSQECYSRLLFKRDLIEPLAWDEPFEVVTKFGTYRFTKKEFYAAFPNIPETRSYREAGLYHGAKLHLKAKRFLVAPPD